jgi:hypothetical protein
MRKAGARSPQGLHQGVQLGDRDRRLAGAAVSPLHNAHRHLGMPGQISRR